MLSALLPVCSLAACGGQAQEMNIRNHVSLETATDTVESTEPSEKENNNELAEPSEAVNGGEAEDSPEIQNVQQSLDRVTPYTEDFDELRDVNHKEMDQDVLPELKISNQDIAMYDTVFIGYPVRAVPNRQSRRQAMRQSHRMALQSRQRMYL